MLDKTKRYLIVGLGLLGGKYALELSKAGFHVDGINRSEGHLQYALDHGYIETGKTHDFEDLVSQADHIIFGLYPTASSTGSRPTAISSSPAASLPMSPASRPALWSRCRPCVRRVWSSSPATRWQAVRLQRRARRRGQLCPGQLHHHPHREEHPRGCPVGERAGRVLGFRHICTLTVQEHDKMIGYVSQLCHAIAVSLMCANDNSSLCEYTGDSFRDLTRIARINEKMWAELFLWNKENLIAEIDQFDSALDQLRDALVADDRDKLEEMFRLSTQRRAAFDKKDS